MSSGGKELEFEYIVQLVTLIIINMHVNISVNIMWIKEIINSKFLNEKYAATVIYSKVYLPT